MAEEITQEIFIKIWASRSELTEINYFNSWLKTLIRNFTYNYLRRIAHEKMIFADIHSNLKTEATVNTMEALEYKQLLQKAIEQLPAQQKKVYLLSRRDGFKHEEIAQEMNLSINTVKNYMKLALESIRLFLDNHTDAMILLALAIFFGD